VDKLDKLLVGARVMVYLSHHIIACKRNDIGRYGHGRVARGARIGETRTKRQAGAHLAKTPLSGEF
jgi:hypothetical protein